MKKHSADDSPLRRARHGFNVLFWLCPILHFLAGSLLFAQQMQSSGYAGFDGQPISTVVISARPGLDIDAMRERIEVKAGKPFSAQELNRSVAALQQTRLFSGGTSESGTRASGASSSIYLAAVTDYVGVVEFPGTGTKFPYTALLQAVDIPEQSPYFSGLEVKSPAGLAGLSPQAWVLLRLTSEWKRAAMKLHRVVNLIFDCDLKKQARVRKIEFTGVSEHQSEQLKAALRGVWARLKRVSLKPGQKYSEPRIAKSIDFIRDRLRTQNRLAPSVRLGSATYDPDSNRGNDLRLNVAAYPEVSVRVKQVRACPQKRSTA